MIRDWRDLDGQFRETPAERAARLSNRRRRAMDEAAPVLPEQFPSHMLPLTARGTCVYLAGNAGGFDLRDCPHPEALAALIVNAVNNRR